MFFNDFRKLKQKQMLVSFDDFELLPVDKRTKKFAKDKRSFLEGEYWQVFPIATNEYHVYIICPHCGQIHVHGNYRNEYEGHRISHCHGDNNGYVIRKEGLK